MNNLNRVISVGEKLVTKNGVMVTVTAQTFGCMPFTSGTCIGTDKGRIEGYEIDVKRTNALTAEAVPA